MDELYYTLDGHEPRPCSRAEYQAMHRNLDRRRVALTDVGRVRVSTVFLGLDHSFGDGPPILFETLAFRIRDSGDWGGSFGETQERYAT